MSEVTKPMLLDDTGKDIVLKLETIANNILEGGSSSVKKLNDIGDVDIVDPENKQGLVYNAELKKWQNGDVESKTLTFNTREEWDDYDKSNLEDGAEVIIKDDETQPKLPPMTKQEWELLDKTDIPDGAEVVITDDSLDGVKINDKFKSTQQCFADRWVSGKTYYVGDIVIWSDRLWKCSVQTSTEEPRDGASCWYETNVARELMEFVIDNLTLSDATHFKANEMKYFKYGKVVTLRINAGNIVGLTKNSTYTIATGLPIPLYMLEDLTIDNEGSPFYYTIDTYGNLAISPRTAVTANNYRYIFSYTYICK